MLLQAKGLSWPRQSPSPSPLVARTLHYRAKPQSRVFARRRHRISVFLPEK